MPVYKSNSPTSDGRCWFYKVSYVDIFGRQQTKVSKKFQTKTEAKIAESQFMIEDIKESKNAPVEMTFKDLYEKFREYQDDKVKLTTKRNYDNKVKHLDSLMTLKCKDFDIYVFEEWKKEINAKPISTTFKNDLLKFLKSILNYGMTWYNFDFHSTYRKISNFNNPNEMRKEMEFYTYEEFLQFIKFSPDLRYTCLFETLYFCGLRCGEARAITWKDIDFKKKTISINKQIQTAKSGKRDDFYIADPKTHNSNRVIPLCDVLLEHLAEYHTELSKYKNFNDSMYVFGDDYGLRPFEPRNIRCKCHRISTNAGLKKIRLHDFRHSCASLLINSGASVTMVAKYLGHTKIDETLNTYSHMFQSVLDGVIEIINNLGKESA